MRTYLYVFGLIGYVIAWVTAMGWIRVEFHDKPQPTAIYYCMSERVGFWYPCRENYLWEKDI